MRTYRSAFGPLFAAAAIGALLANLLTNIVVADPEESGTWVVPSLLSLAAIIPVAVSEAAVLVMVLDKRAGNGPTVSTAYAVGLRMAPRFVGAALLLGLLLAAALVLTLLVPFLIFATFPFALFVIARWSLYGPAIVLGDTSAVGALRLSGQLVSGRTLRTLGILALLFGASLFAFAVAAALSDGVGGRVGPSIVIGALSIALVQPFAFIVTLLLYEDYQRVPPPTRQALPGPDPSGPDQPHDG